MTEADFIVIMRILDMNWEELAQALGISARHLRRYRNGEQRVPKTVKLALEALICRRHHQHLEPGDTGEDRLRLEETYGATWV